MKKKQNINYLDLTPVQNVNYESTDGLVVLLIPKFTHPLMVKYLMPRLKSQFIKIKLDELGTTTWNLIDGTSNVRQICEALKNSRGNQFTYAEERVTKFLTYLYNGKAITFKEIS
jgi:hypothetical protein